MANMVSGRADRSRTKASVTLASADASMSPMPQISNEAPPVAPRPMMAGGVKATMLAAAMSCVRPWICPMMADRQVCGAVRSSQGSSSTMHMAAFSPLPLSMLMPETCMTDWMPGMAARRSRTVASTASVRSWTASPGNSTLQKMTPLSSVGKNEGGICPYRSHTPKKVPPSIPSVSPPRRTRRPVMPR